MKKHFLYSLMLCGALLAGCAEPSLKDGLNGVKFTDIRPMYKKGSITPQDDFAAEIVFLTVNVPLDNFVMADDLWDVFLDDGLLLANSDAFRANGWLAGFGSEGKWLDFQNFFRQAGCRKAGTTVMMVTPSQPDYVYVSKLSAKTDIYYYAGNGLVENVSVSAGKAGFKFKLEKIPGARGLAGLSITPFYEADLPGVQNQTLFNPMKFDVDLSQGEFVLLGPVLYDSEPSRLSGLFFNQPGRTPAAKMYLITCRRIIE